MGIIAKEGSKNAIIMYVGALLGAVNTILLYPKILPEKWYGLISVLTSMSILIAGIGLFGSSATIIKYLPFYRDKETKTNGGLIKYLVSLTLGISLVLIVVLVIFKPWLQQPFEKGAALLVDYYYYVIPLFVFNVLIELFSSYSNALFKTSLQMFQKEVFLRLGQTFLIGLYYFGFLNLHSFVLSYLLMYLISLLVLLTYLYRLGELKFSSVSMLPKKERKEILKFSRYTFFSSMANSFAFRIDALMIGSMIVNAVLIGALSINSDGGNEGLKATAIYFVALNIASVIEMPFRAINQIVVPTIAHAFKEKDMTKIDMIYTKTTETMIIVGGFVFLGIWSCIDQVINILPKEYAEVKYVFFWLAVGKIVNTATGMNGQILVNSHLYKLFTYFTVLGLVLTIGLNYVFINEFGTTGAALATAITYFVINALIWFVLLWKFRLQPFHAKNVLVVLLGVCIYFAVSKWNVYNDVITISIKALTITLLYWFVILKFRFSSDISEGFEKVMARIGIKNKL